VPWCTLRGTLRFAQGTGEFSNHVNFELFMNLNTITYCTAYTWNQGNPQAPHCMTGLSREALDQHPWWSVYIEPPCYPHCLRLTDQ
jgi:hypothetical protein